MICEASKTHNTCMPTYFPELARNVISASHSTVFHRTCKQLNKLGPFVGVMMNTGLCSYIWMHANAE